MKYFIFTFVLLLSFQALAQEAGAPETCHGNMRATLLGEDNRHENATECIDEAKSVLEDSSFYQGETLAWEISFCEYKYNTNWTKGQVRQILNSTSFSDNRLALAATYYLKAAFLLYNADYLLEKKFMSFEELAFQAFEHLNACIANFAHKTDKAEDVKKNISNGWSDRSSQCYWFKLYSIQVFAIKCHGILETFIISADPPLELATWLKAGKMQSDTALALLLFHDTFMFCAQFYEDCAKYVNIFKKYYHDHDMQEVRAILGVSELSSNTSFNPFAKTLSHGYPFPDDVTYRKNSQYKFK